eukprot:TRINITY_DN6048_c0_g7_i2.p1 TRINITY_DN6048_c0_g7~~TRINITY_DN6048_c0_g7_i2.p1  ORF type:complete len:189 (-),score=27.34 TRINITY_DN6048_c0_g7_i2:267-833(-)
MFCTFGNSFSKLPKFIDNNGPSERIEARESKKPPVESVNLKTLKAHLLSELQSFPLVYERLYPHSLPVAQRKSLLLTELCTVNSLEELGEYGGKVLTEEEMKPYYVLKGPEDKTLVFESRFECGNLKLCIKKGECEYDLYLQNDVNTQGNNQWFFFRVQNTFKNTTVTFNINNFVFTHLILEEGGLVV